MLEHQWIKSIERAERLLIIPVYSLRAIRANGELQTAVTGVGQVTQTVITILIGTFLTTKTYEIISYGSAHRP